MPAEYDRRRRALGIGPPTLAEITNEAIRRNNSHAVESVNRGNELLDRLGYSQEQQLEMRRAASGCKVVPN